MLEIINISQKYNNFTLQNINFSVKKGEYFVLLGRSGSGKSLLFEIISGFKQADCGQIILDGKNITKHKIQNRQIGVVFQDYAAFPHKTVRENIIYSIKNKKSKKEVELIIAEYSKSMNIEHILDQKPSTLSGGEIQRMVIARTLISEPKILLLDEPLSALDTQLKNEIRTLLKEINKKTGITVIHITHDYDETIRLADKVGIINKGKLLQIGSIKEVFSRPTTKFTANLAGIQNFFRANLITIENKKTKKAILESIIEIDILSEDLDGEGFVIIRSEDIILSKEFHESSARNNFKGKILTITPERSGYEIIIDVSIKFTAIITENSLEFLKLTEGDEIWISFKASSIQFIKN